MKKSQNLLYIFVSLFKKINVSKIICCTKKSEVGQVAQAARRLTTGWTARVRSPVSEGWRFLFTHSCSDWSWGSLSLLWNEYRGFPWGLSRPSVGLATLPLPSAVAVYIGTLVSTSSLHNAQTSSIYLSFHCILSGFNIIIWTRVVVDNYATLGH